MKQTLRLTWQLWKNFLLKYHRWIAASWMLATWTTLIISESLRWITFEEDMFFIIGSVVAGAYYLMFSYGDLKRNRREINGLRDAYHQSVREVKASYDTQLRQITQNFLDSINSLTHKVE